MKTRMYSSPARLSGRSGLLALLLLLGLGGCGLDEVKVPPLIGPSELGLSLEMTANPDTINADGVSQSVVRIFARDENGRPAPGRQLYVTLQQGDGVLVAGSVVVGLLQTGVSLSTDSGGLAQVVYTAGLSPGTIAIVGVRPYSFDATVIPFERTVHIIQR